ncbi:MAG: hypothetical protein V1918_01130, partial [Planctomycetota bacterium]
RAFRALDWWEARCLEWCHAWHEPGLYSDQQYLDRFPELFEGVHVLRNVRCCLAPWNLPSHRVERRGGEVRVDGDTPLVFYHFQGFRAHAPDLFTLAVDYRLRAEDRTCLYRPYAAAVREAMETVRALDPEAYEKSFVPLPKPGPVRWLKRLKRKILGKNNLTRAPF